MMGVRSRGSSGARTLLSAVLTLGDPWTSMCASSATSRGLDKVWCFGRPASRWLQPSRNLPGKVRQARRITPFILPWHAYSCCWRKQMHWDTTCKIRSVLLGDPLDFLRSKRRLKTTAYHVQACLWTPSELSGWLEKKGSTDKRFVYCISSWDFHSQIFGHSQALATINGISASSF